VKAEASGATSEYALIFCIKESIILEHCKSVNLSSNGNIILGYGVGDYAKCV
jgi:hypothetical protein